MHTPEMNERYLIQFKCAQFIFYTAAQIFRLLLKGIQLLIERFQCKCRHTIVQITKSSLYIIMFPVIKRLVTSSP